MELQRIHIVTNSKFVCKNFGKNSLWWSLDEFMRQKAMTFSLCTAEAEDLYRLLHMIEVLNIFELKCSTVSRTSLGFLWRNAVCCHFIIFVLMFPHHSRLH